MANPAKDLLGQKFGYLTVIRRAGTTTHCKTQKATWVCQCQCGNEVIRESQYLRAKYRTHPRSCGCHHGNETHKLSGSAGFNIWSKMKQRCQNPADKDWKHYGGRGITVCERWLQAFENFWADMGPTYQPGLTLDRIKNSRGYSKVNCRWATAQEQANNKRTNVHINTPEGELTVADAARRFGLKPITIYQRLARGNVDVLRPVASPFTI